MTNPELVMIAKGLKNLRKSHNLTQIDLGVEHYLVSNIENAKKFCSMKTYEKIASRFDMGLLEFFNYCYNNYNL